KVMRIQRLDKLRKLRSHDVNDKEEEEEVPVQTIPMVTSTKGFLANILDLVKTIWFKVIDMTINFLHWNNIVYRLNLKPKATTEEIESKMEERMMVANEEDAVNKHKIFGYKSPTKLTKEMQMESVEEQKKEIRAVENEAISEQKMKEKMRRYEEDISKGDDGLVSVSSSSDEEVDLTKKKENRVARILRKSREKLSRKRKGKTPNAVPEDHTKQEKKEISTQNEDHSLSSDEDGDEDIAKKVKFERMEEKGDEDVAQEISEESEGSEEIRSEDDEEEKEEHAKSTAIAKPTPIRRGKKKVVMCQEMVLTKESPEEMNPIQRPLSPHSPRFSPSSRALSSTELELIDIEQTEGKYPYHGRFYLVIWGLYFFFSRQTEALVQVIFILNAVINRNILSAIYPIAAFGIVAVSRKPFPSKKFWTFMSVVSVVLILVRLFFQLPGFCIKPNAKETYDVLSYTTSVYDVDTMQCSATPLTKNHMSFIYIFGVYPVSSYFLSRFVWDIFCLFAILVHILCMRNRGYWEQQYLLRREWSNVVIENHRRELVNKIKPNTFGELKFIVEALKDFEPSEGDVDHFAYKQHDLFVVEAIQVDGQLFVTKGNYKGLVDCENFKVYEHTTKSIARKEKSSPVIYKKTFKKSYRVKEEKINDEFEMAKENEEKMYLTKSLEVNQVVTEMSLQQFLKGQEVYLKDQETIELNKSKMTQFFNRTRLGLKIYYDHLVNDKFKTGADYYIPMFICEVICFVFLIVFQGSFTNLQGNFIEFFTSDYLPIT
ncbi:hypothetical protein EIN_328320, partial [Entamoeba invadens IP1]